MKLIWVAGARPNFMKIAAIWRAMLRHNENLGPGDVPFKPILVHTGQHYDANMSEVFFKDLSLPAPHYYLGIGGGTHGEQTARILIEFEKILASEMPQMVGVVGDVNSSCACALAAAKSYVLPGGYAPLLVHVEAGIRSGDRRIPEEVNRIVVDALSDVFFTPEEAGDGHLLSEGKAPEAIHQVGNVMVDSVLDALERGPNDVPLRDRGLLDATGAPRAFGLVTLHRPSNVDDRDMLTRVIAALQSIAEDLPMVFPVHPRTRTRMEELGLHAQGADCPGGPSAQSGLMLLPPLGYSDFLALQAKATFVITDSGGVQAETTALGVPCLTLRENTEWPVTVTMGSNTLVGQDPDRLVREARMILSGRKKAGGLPPLWDGRSAERIVAVLAKIGEGRA